MCDVYGEANLRQKMFTNLLNMGFLLWTRVRETVYVVETHWLFAKEKVPSTAVSKEGHTDNLLGH